MTTIQHYIYKHSIYKYASGSVMGNRFGPVSCFQDAVNLVTHNRIKTELIGQWLFCFTTALIGVQLLALGFWYSHKHSAYVYTGRSKDGIANDETLDEIKARLGTSQIF
jgi:hypothetical protein